MTFADIATQCGAFPRQQRSGRRTLGSEFLQGLTAPHRRGWFKACHTWLHSGPSPDEYAEIQDLLASMNDFQRTMATVHRRCVELILTRDHWHSLQELTDSLAALAKEFDLAEGFLRDLAQELLTPSAQLQVATSPTAFCGALTHAVRDQSLIALFVEGPQGTPGKGVVTTLTLELIDKGHGEIYPIPALAFVERDKNFRDAEDAALAWVRDTAQLWQHAWDARWRLERRDGVPLLPRLDGNSLGGAFALGLAKLAVGA